MISETLSRRNRDVGMSGVVCTTVHAMAPYDVLTWQCLVTLSLERGQITLQGLIEIQGEEDMGPFTLAITGGTDKYSGASGTARFRGSGPTTGDLPSALRQAEEAPRPPPPAAVTPA